MHTADPHPLEETLDPARAGSLAGRGYFRLSPHPARPATWQPLPLEPSEVGQAYRDFLQHVVPYEMGSPYPRFWGWYMGNGTMTGRWRSSGPPCSTPT